MPTLTHQELSDLFLVPGPLGTVCSTKLGDAVPKAVYLEATVVAEYRNILRGSLVMYQQLTALFNAMCGLQQIMDAHGIGETAFADCIHKMQNGILATQLIAREGTEEFIKQFAANGGKL